MLSASGGVGDESESKKPFDCLIARACRFARPFALKPRGDETAAAKRDSF